MLSLLGQAFAVQSYVTGEGPYANWSKHVADPFGYNLVTIVGNEDRYAGLQVYLSCCLVPVCLPSCFILCGVCFVSLN